jgi:hypothetical protein
MINDKYLMLIYFLFLFQQENKKQVFQQIDLKFKYILLQAFYAVSLVDWFWVGNA